MADIRNPFNPMRFTGRGGLLTVEEASRLQDLIKGAGDTYARTINQILQQFDVAITNVTGMSGAAGSQGIPGLDGEDGADGLPGPAGARGAQGVAGLPGLDGQDGEDAIIIPGLRGAAGAAGLMGPPGFDGDDADAGLVILPSPIIWPSRQSILVSSGPSSLPTKGAFFEYDFNNDIIQLGDQATLAFYNTGKDGTGNYERLRLSRSSNVYTLTSEKGGVGTTVRSLTIDASTATLTTKANSVDINGATGVQIGYLAGVLSTPAVLVGGTTSVAIAAGTGTHPSQSFAQSQIVIDTSVALSGGFPAGSTWNGFNVTGGATVPGTGTITAAFASTKFSHPTITGTGVGATVNEAATVLIAGGPIGSGLSVNVKYALWVQADVARFDGTMMFPTVANGAVATALTSVGPVGSHTTVQKWFKFQDSATGIDYYVPGF